MTEGPQRWNHNVHYHAVVRERLPQRCQRILDVGCGEGMLVRDLSAPGRRVTGIDTDAASIAAARRHPSDAEYIRADFLAHPFKDEPFDAVVSIAALHHMEPDPALRRMSDLLRPGGSLIVVGCARSEMPRDLPYELAAFTANKWISRSRTYWEHSAPTVWPPAQTYRDVRRMAASVLPGSQFRRHLLWRYSISWTKP
jgi:2-polyprenyl-3-methyl-5-hydroxy-6-metoxy-1,4-benzoquinol methylase